MDGPAGSAAAPGSLAPRPARRWSDSRPRGGRGARLTDPPPARQPARGGGSHRPHVAHRTSPAPRRSRTARVAASSPWRFRQRAVPWPRNPTTCMSSGATRRNAVFRKCGCRHATRRRACRAVQRRLARPPCLPHPQDPRLCEASPHLGCGRRPGNLCSALAPPAPRPPSAVRRPRRAGPPLRPGHTRDAPQPHRSCLAPDRVPQPPHSSPRKGMTTRD